MIESPRNHTPAPNANASSLNTYAFQMQSEGYKKVSASSGIHTIDMTICGNLALPRSQHLLILDSRSNALASGAVMNHFMSKDITIDAEMIIADLAPISRALASACIFRFLDGRILVPLSLLSYFLGRGSKFWGYWREWRKAGKTGC